MACLSIISFEIFAQLSVVSDRVSSRYETGEQARFNVTSNTSGSATYRIGYDAISQPIETGTINIQSGATISIPYTASEPAHVMCEVTQNGNVQKAAASFSCFDIDPITNPPNDFKSFWNSQIAASNGVPLNPTVVPHSSSAMSTTYKLYFSNIDGRGVSGFISIPNGSGTYPCVVTVPPYGNDPNIVVPETAFAEWSNAISVSISIHNTYDVTQTDPNAYFPDEIDNRNNIYYRYAIMAAIRAIDYVETRPDFDQTNVAVYGVSQGGGLAILLAGIDDRISVLMNSSPTLCQHDGHHVEKASGFPYYVNRSRGEVGTAAHEDATVYASSYYDAVHSASFFDGHTLMGVSYLDEIAPAGSVFPAYNNIKGEHKVMIHSSRAAHDNSQEFWEDKFKMLRLAWPEATANPPFQFVDTGLGYVIEAGNDINTSNSSVSLAAVVSTDNGVNNTFPVKWEMVSGPGNVSFTNQFGRNTNASFSAAGTYVLKITAEDATSLAFKNIHYSVEDFITITAGGGGTTQQNQTINFPAIADKVTTDNPFNISATATSGLDVTLTLISGPATLNGNTISLNGQVGTVTVKAEQAGNSDWFAASTVFQSFNVTAPDNGGGDCSSTSNIALNKSATQSSTSLSASASRAIDGNTNGDFWGANSVTYTNWESNPWLQVDLGSTHNIEQLKVWNRTDCCQSNLSNYHILISNTPFTSNNLNTSINQNGVTNIVQNTAAGTPSTLPANVSGRYVRLQLAGTGILAIAELEIIGCTDAPTGCTTVGNACNDGDACTTNDVINADCNCEGTFADSDNDGVCNANDICPGGDDNIDSDNDGTPDFCDGCSTTGQSCNDGNACTTNDVINANCNCVGTFADSDNDGVCDANDICPGGDDNVDSDNDGTPDFCDGCNTVGQACNDGNACTINDVINAACNCIGTFADSDGDGVCNANDICPGGDDNVDSDNDGTPDFCDSPDTGECPTSLSGYTFIGTHNGHNYFKSNTQQTFPVAQADAAANGGYVVTINDAAENEFVKSNISDIVFIGLNDAGSEGNLVWANGDPLNYNNINVCAFCAPNNAANDYVVMTFWDGLWSFSNEWSSRIYIIELDCNGGGEGCTTIGQSCNDGDDCTSGDVYDANCNCSGTYQDSDSDGICNSEDICEGFNDNVDTDNDGTPDGCDPTPNGNGGSNGDCTSTTNLAVNKPASQSGTQLGSVASRANDGNTDGNYWGSNSVSNTDWVNNAWWEVDLGAVYNIEEINLWNRTDCCQSTFANYHVFISNTPFTSTDLNTTINQNGVTNLFQSGIAGTPSNIPNTGTGRYVRVQLAGQGALVMAEVEILGCSGATLPNTSNYCGSNGNSTAYEYIERFNIGNIDNTSGSNNGYKDFTNQSASLPTGGYFTFNMTPGFTGNASNVWWTIWIDLNGDGDFYDSNEEIFKAVSSSQRSGTALIPNSATTGNTRMRIAMSANGYVGPCQVFPYGEVEDYNINIYPNNAPFISDELDSDLNDKIVLMPNPVEDLLVVELFDDYLEFEKMTVQVHNAQGLLMSEMDYSELPYGTQFLIETNDFKAGYYLLTIQRDTIRTVNRTVKPFIKMRN